MANAWVSVAALPALLVATLCSGQVATLSIQSRQLGCASDWFCYGDGAQDHRTSDFRSSLVASVRQEVQHRFPGESSGGSVLYRLDSYTQRGAELRVSLSSISACSSRDSSQTCVVAGAATESIRFTINRPARIGFSWSVAGSSRHIVLVGIGMVNATPINDIVWFNALTSSPRQAAVPYLSTSGLYRLMVFVNSTADSGVAPGESSADASVVMRLYDAADLDKNDRVDIGDLFAFLRAWFSAESDGDFVQDGVFDVADVLSYLTAWFSGQ